MNDGNPTQLNFNIPKIKKKVSKDNLRSVDLTSRDATDILQTIDQRCLDHSYKGQWQVTSVQIVDNPELESTYRKKRLELKEDGRHNRELSEQFCFLSFRSDHQVANRVVKQGLKTRLLNISPLGDSKSGVYLCRHPDVQLRVADGRDEAKTCICVFKVTLGRCKSMPVASMDSIVEPTPNFDSHISATVAQPTDTPTTQMLRSQVYLFEYTDEALPSERPRHCLPYALVDFKKNQSVSKSTSRPRSSYDRSAESWRMETEPAPPPSWSVRMSRRSRESSAADPRNEPEGFRTDHLYYPAAEGRRTSIECQYPPRIDARRENVDEQSITAGIMFPYKATVFPQSLISGVPVMTLNVPPTWREDPEAARRRSIDNQQNSEHGQTSADAVDIPVPEAKILSPEIQTMIKTVNELWGKPPEHGQAQIYTETDSSVNYSTFIEPVSSDFNFKPSATPESGAVSGQNSAQLGKRVDPRIDKVAVMMPDPNLKQKVPEVAGLSTEADIKDLNESIEALNENKHTGVPSNQDKQQGVSPSHAGPMVDAKDSIQTRVDTSHNEKSDTSTASLPVTTRSGKKKISLKDYSSRVSIAKKTQVSSVASSKTSPVSDSKSDGDSKVVTDSISEPKSELLSDSHNVETKSAELPNADNEIGNTSKLSDKESTEISANAEDKLKSSLTSNPAQEAIVSYSTSAVKDDGIADYTTSAVMNNNATSEGAVPDTSQSRFRGLSSFDSPRQTGYTYFDSPSKASHTSCSIGQPVYSPSKASHTSCSIGQPVYSPSKQALYSSPVGSYKSMFSPLSESDVSDVEQSMKTISDGGMQSDDIGSTTRPMISSQDVYRTSGFTGEAVTDQQPPVSVQDLVSKLQAIGNIQDVLQKYKFPLPSSGTSSHIQLSPVSSKPGTLACPDYDVDMRLQREASLQYRQNEYDESDAQRMGHRSKPTPTYHMGYEEAYSQSENSTYIPRSVSPRHDLSQQSGHAGWKVNARSDKADQARYPRQRSPRRPRSPRSPRSPRRRNSWTRYEPDVNAYGDVDMRCLWKPGSHSSEESRDSRSGSSSRSERGLQDSGYTRMETHTDQSFGKGGTASLETDDKKGYPSQTTPEERRLDSPSNIMPDFGIWVAPKLVIQGGQLSKEADYTPRKLLAASTEVKGKNLSAVFEEIEQSKAAVVEKDSISLTYDAGKSDSGGSEITQQLSVTEQLQVSGISKPQDKSAGPTAVTATTTTTTTVLQEQPGSMTGAVAALAALWSSQEVANQMVMPDTVEEAQETDDSKVIPEKSLETSCAINVTSIAGNATSEVSPNIARAITPEPSVNVAGKNRSPVVSASISEETTEKDILGQTPEKHPNLDNFEDQFSSDGKAESKTSVETYHSNVSRDRSDYFQSQWSHFARDDFDMEIDYTDFSFDMPHQFEETIPDGTDSPDVPDDRSGENTPVQDEMHHEHDQDGENRSSTPLIDERPHDHMSFTSLDTPTPAVVSSLITSAPAIIHEPLAIIHQSGYQPLTSHLLVKDTLVTTSPSSKHFTPIDSPYVVSTGFDKSSACGLGPSVEAADDTVKDTESDRLSRQGTPVQDEPYLTSYAADQQVNSSAGLQESKSYSVFQTTHLQAGQLQSRDTSDISTIGRQSAFTPAVGGNSQDSVSVTESRKSKKSEKQQMKLQEKWPQVYLVDFRKTTKLDEKNSCTLCQNANCLARKFKADLQCMNKDITKSEKRNETHQTCLSRSLDDNDVKSKLTVDTDIKSKQVVNDNIKPKLVVADDVKPKLVSTDKDVKLKLVLTDKNVKPKLVSTDKDVKPKLVLTEKDVKPKLVVADKDVTSTLVAVDTKQTLQTSDVANNLTVSDISYETKCLHAAIKDEDVKKETDKNEVSRNELNSEVVQQEKSSTFWHNVASLSKKKKDSIKKELDMDIKYLNESGHYDGESKKVETYTVKDEKTLPNEVEKKNMIVKTSDTDDIDVIGTHTQVQIPTTVEKKTLSIKFKKKETKKNLEPVPVNPVSNIQRISTLGKTYLPSKGVQEKIHEADVHVSVACSSSAVLRQPSPTQSVKSKTPSAPVSVSSVKRLPVTKQLETVSSISKSEDIIWRNTEPVAAKVSTSSDARHVEYAQSRGGSSGSSDVRHMQYAQSRADTSGQSIPVLGAARGTQQKSDKLIPTTVTSEWSSQASGYQQVPVLSCPSVSPYVETPAIQNAAVSGSVKYVSQNPHEYVSSQPAPYPPVHSLTHTQPVQSSSYLSHHVNIATTRLASSVPVPTVVSSASVGAFRPQVPQYHHLTAPGIPTQFRPVTNVRPPGGQSSAALPSVGVRQMTPMIPRVSYPPVGHYVSYPQVPSTVLSQRVPAAPLVQLQYPGGFQPNYYRPVSAVAHPPLVRQDQKAVQYSGYYPNTQKPSTKSSDLTEWFADIVAPKREQSRSPTCSESDDSVTSSISSDGRKRDISTSDCSIDSPMAKRKRPVVTNLRHIPLEDSGGGTISGSHSEQSNKKNSGSFLVHSSRDTSLGDMLCAGKDRKSTDSPSSHMLETNCEVSSKRQKHNDEVETTETYRIQNKDENRSKHKKFEKGFKSNDPESNKSSKEIIKSCTAEYRTFEKEIFSSVDAEDCPKETEVDTDGRNVSVYSQSVGNKYKSYSLDVEVTNTVKEGLSSPETETEAGYTSSDSEPAGNNFNIIAPVSSSFTSSCHLPQDLLSKVTIKDLSVARMTILNALNQLPVSTATDCEGSKTPDTNTPPGEEDIYDPSVPTVDSEEEGELKSDDTQDWDNQKRETKFKNTFVERGERCPEKQKKFMKL
ncbi:uncharacterized protein LOC121378446 [Gigantopelta aegis]|uniref:uncharacterized protein LOC121378446 n=1 Tax=Gigantopelta aegis TaxID=1735272 RepID=UPI001B88DCE7|nr:uncharacterized protein LOC121378446 [Gigantopelta aegis]